MSTGPETEPDDYQHVKLVYERGLFSGRELWIYLHDPVSTLPQQVAKAISNAAEWWDNPDYVAADVMRQLIADLGRKSGGLGISPTAWRGRFYAGVIEVDLEECAVMAKPVDFADYSLVDTEWLSYASFSALHSPPPRPGARRR